MIDWTKPHNWIVFLAMLLIICLVLNQVAARNATVDKALSSVGLNH